MDFAAAQSPDSMKLAELIGGIRVAFLHTFPTSGELAGRSHARPMYTQKMDPKDFTGELWFMTDTTGEKVGEIIQNPHVEITYTDIGPNRYVVVLGNAKCTRNPAKARELWNVHSKDWWPDGPESTNLLLVRVLVDTAEYWDGPSSESSALTLPRQQ